MNLLKQAFGIQSEAERLRELYAGGKPLPAMPVPTWVEEQRPTALGMTRLPHASLSGGGGMDWGTTSGVVFLFIVGAMLLGAGSFQPSDPFRSDNSIQMTVFGIGLLIVAAIGWIDHKARNNMQPESSTIRYSPGDAVLLMLPRRHRATGFARAQLLFQERWYIEQGKSSHWDNRQIRSIPVTFKHSGDSLMTASVAIPADAPPSYHTINYRHEWALAITHVTWWGFPRTDHYLLWVGDSD